MLINAGLLVFLGFQMGSVEAAQPQPVSQWVQDAWQRLPLVVQRELGSADRIPIEFKRLGRQAFSLPQCEALSPSQKQSHKKLFYGRSVSAPLGLSRILIHEGLLPEIERGDGAATIYECGHRNGYRLAVATLIHEWMHVYDQKVRLSESRRFRALSHFHRIHHWSMDLLTAGLVAPLTQKNKTRLRSPDPYELKNPREALAVNFEYFLLDPEYACRRPSLHAFFMERFPDPFAGQRQCASRSTVMLHSRNPALDLKLPADLNPARVAEIHYLYADTGEAAMSRWGHAMYRLVVCAPERKTVGSECRNDIAHHVVVSYRANVTDIMINSVKGITGRYPSKMFLMPLSEVIAEYTKEELRDLISLPLKLTETEKQAFLESTIESYWGYLGKYTFFTNNCGTESLHLLQTSSESASTSHLRSLTPRKLYRTLIRRGWVDESQKTVFQSKKADFDSALKILGVTRENYFALQALQRRELVREKILAHPDQREKIAAAAFVIESSVEFAKNKEFEKSVLQEIESPHSDIKEAVERLAKEMQSKSSGAFVQAGYGIPLSSEWLELTQSRSDSEIARDAELKQMLEKRFALEAKELNDIKLNKSQFRKWILKPLS